ncbi:MAG: hypothetical protein DRI48_08515 [Chloroflexi bacterium]|nr:MAG: hypothetical protein DRI48_08515 [Chloroflexota bacterium]
MDVDTWKKRVEAERRRKDIFFASHPQSPLSAEDRRIFRGLAYWPPDPAYRNEIKMDEHKEKEILHVGDTAGRVRELLRWGAFAFDVAGQRYVLQAYKSDPNEEGLFVPFKDATSGVESYGAGRYLDLKPYEHLTKEGKWVLDLNAAYNPWCAYSEDYACPFVPPENWLEVSIRAGEKEYPLKVGGKKADE